MYAHHFRLDQLPFSIAPDPRYLFMSERHREALAHLLYGIDAGGGIVLLTGEIGTGKTTLCRSLLGQIPDNCNVAYVFNPKLTVVELLAAICAEFRVGLPQNERRKGTRAWVDALNRYLLEQHAAGRNNVLLIDEAQNLAPDVLEQLRLLTNLETNERKLLQIILIGQPELRTILAQPKLEQMAQRVIAHYHLGPLNEQETASYVQHRLATAGMKGPSPFQPAVMRHVHRFSGGVPRRINLLCDRALLGAYAEGVHVVNRRILEHAASELFVNQQQARGRGRTWQPYALGAAAGVVLALGTTMLVARQSAGPAPGLAAVQAAEPSLPVSAPALRKQETRDQEVAEAPPQQEPKAGPNDEMATQATEAAPEPSPAFAGIPTEHEALRQLAALWDGAETAGTPCARSSTRGGLYCYRSDGGLAALRQLDRPAVLRLYDADGAPYYALLTGLGEDGLRLQAGPAHQQVDMPTLMRHFRGEFITLWRAPAGGGTPVTLGRTGEAVDWVGMQLARVNGTELPAARQPYNLGLHGQVKRFQQAQGLAVDGVVGPVTFMHLNRVAGVAEPRLLGASVEN